MKPTSGPKPAYSGGWLAIYPAVGLALFFLGAILFGAITFGVQTSPAVIAWDKQVSQNLHDIALSEPRPLVNLIGGASFYLGSQVIVLLVIGLAALLISRRHWREAWMVLLGAGGSGAWWFLMSRFFDRPRPSYPVALDTVTAPSYPSGHSAAALIFYTLLAYLLVPRLKSRLLRAVVILLSVLLWLFVGFGRLYVGGHYPTDVLGGYAFGLAWGALVFTAIERAYARRSTHEADAMVESTTHNDRGRT